MKELALLVFTLLGFSYGAYIESYCGYKTCPATKLTTINVHLIPHSHDDVGWLKTVDQYYYGSKNNIQKAGVQYILDSVVDELLKDKQRRFIFVESAFFFQWFDEQSKEKRENVVRLVKEGRLEFAGGAWSMNDEAASHYQSIIDQFTLGLKTLDDTFGVCARPRVGWQIDPFGHSREMASIFAQMGYDGEFFARVDWMDKATRLHKMTAEMIWKTSESLGHGAELFTGILYNHYSAPPSFCFDQLCSDDPIVDGDSYDNNVKERVDTFLEYVLNMSAHYRSSHLMVPMGDDFNYGNAEQNFKNMDKLIKYVNERQFQGSKINVFYSTPSCYLKSLHEQPHTWPNKTQDFFPYSTNATAYWTGYYSSRPTQKRFERDGNHFLQVAKQLTVLANLTGAEVHQKLNSLQKIIGVLQHHDAITGTAKQHVADDYARLLSDGLTDASVNTQTALRHITNMTDGEFGSCWLLNISYCEFTKDGANDLVITVVNPLAQSTYQFVRVPVLGNADYVVTDMYGTLISSELVPIPKAVLNIPYRSAGHTHELVFEAYVLKVANYYMKEKNVKETKANPAKAKQPKRNKRAADTVVSNSLVKLTFSASGHLSAVEMNGVSEKIRQDFFQYNAAHDANGTSGAYIFRPVGVEKQISAKVSLTIHNGSRVKEVHQQFNEWVSQVIRLYDGVNRVEFEWLVGPIPLEKVSNGSEIITRFTSSINSNGVFWTDSNGREMIRRVKNQRENFQPNVSMEEVASNYYPVTTRIAVQDEQKRLALLTDRAQGGASLTNGALELMLHRRLLHDDGFGVAEALNETAYGKGLIVRGKINLILSSVPSRHSMQERLAQSKLHLPLWFFFSKGESAEPRSLQKIADFSSVPMGVQILSLEPFSPKERLIRFENYMDVNETTAITFNIRGVFDNLNGKEIRETTLDGSLPLSEMQRLRFQEDGSPALKSQVSYSHHAPFEADNTDSSAKFSITLDPMQIRTFVIRWR